MSHRMGSALLALLALLSCLLALSGAATSQEREVPGDVQFAENCARCHRNAAELVSGLSGDEVDLRSDLAALLPRHHAPDPTARNTIIDYLAGLAAE